MTITTTEPLAAFTATRPGASFTGCLHLTVDLRTICQAIDKLRLLGIPTTICATTARILRQHLKVPTINAIDTDAHYSAAYILSAAKVAVQEPAP